jgi:hypothetical protein
MKFNLPIWATLLGSAMVIGCYRPNISQAGLKCAAGDVCPDGFHCASNGLCYEGDAGPTAPVCNFPPPTPSCATAPASGQQCNPSCQTGCDCGFCSVSSGATTCLPMNAGNGAVGDICDPGKPAPCQQGLYCKPECGSSDPTLGRCYRFCTAASDCQICSGDGACQSTTCTVTETSTSSTGQPFSFKLCSQPIQQCSPLGPTSGCPTTDSAFACYSESDDTYCDCKGTITPNPTKTPCNFVGDCIPGYSCVPFGGGVANSCLPTCRSNTDCTAPAMCNLLAGDHVFGYCD